MSAFVPPVCLTIAGSDSSGGAGLQADLKTFEALLGELLLPKARLLTPNRSEAAVLLGWSEGVREENARAAAEAIAERFSTAVVVTGGAGEGPEVVDWLVTSAGVERLAHPRVQGRHRHGAGCTLSAAIAAGLALGHGLVEAVVQARDFVVRAMRAAPTFGDGEGPLWHRAGVGPSDFGFTSSTR